MSSPQPKAHIEVEDDTSYISSLEDESSDSFKDEDFLLKSTDELSDDNKFSPIKDEHTIDKSKLEGLDLEVKLDNSRLVENEETESDDELDLNNLPETVKVLKGDNDKTIYLVGTSHFSKQSHRDVRRVIRAVKPKIVMVELCRNRMWCFFMDEKEILEEAKSLNFNKILGFIKKKGFIEGLVHILLLSASAKVTKDLGMAPGGEFRNAFIEAGKIPGCAVMLGDRPIATTLRRSVASLSAWQKIKLTYNCIFSFEKLSEEELEKYKQKDVLENLIKELSVEFPGLSKVMVEERDKYLAYSLNKACHSAEPGGTVVGVVGIGHAAGIEANWDNVESICVDELLKVPDNKPSKTMLVIKYSFYGAMAFGIYRYAIPKTVKSFIHSTGLEVSRRIFGS